MTMCWAYPDRCTNTIWWEPHSKTCPMMAMVALAGFIDSLIGERAPIEDRDPGDEQPEPDYTAMINAAIDRRVAAMNASMNPAPLGAGHGSP